MQANRTMLENMIMQGQSIQNNINTIVRNAVTVGLRTYFEPKMQQYLKNISEVIYSDISINDDTPPLISAEETEENCKAREAVKNVVSVGASAVGAAIGTIIGGPVGTVVGAIVGALATLLGNVFSSQSRENEEQKNAMLLHNVLIKQFQQLSAVLAHKSRILFQKPLQTQMKN